MAKCPWMGKCEPECVFYRKGLRYFEDGKQPIPFEECAINIGVDCLENLVSRSIGNQKATEETRNEIKSLHNLFMGLAQRKMVVE